MGTVNAALEGVLGNLALGHNIITVPLPSPAVPGTDLVIGVDTLVLSDDSAQVTGLPSLTAGVTPTVQLVDSSGIVAKRGFGSSGSSAPLSFVNESFDADYYKKMKPIPFDACPLAKAVLEQIFNNGSMVDQQAYCNEISKPECSSLPSAC